MAGPKKASKKIPEKKLTKKAAKPAIKRAVRKPKVKAKAPRPLDLRRSEKNPIIRPNEKSYWESEAVFNPGAFIHDNRIHIFYRALGPDGISRVGHASSEDGVHFDRTNFPVYMPEVAVEALPHTPYTTPVHPTYDRALYASGGGWGGCEDPRAVKIDDRIYMTFNLFNGWDSIRVGLTSISEQDFEAGHWRWNPLKFLSPAKERHKNWVLFPEKINGKFAIFHNMFAKDPGQVCIDYLEDLKSEIPPIKSPDPHLLPDREAAWHYRTRGIGPPPVWTPAGWLVFYHAMDKLDKNRYKLGALLLDLSDPRRITHRSSYPILEPDEWYENDWKPGIIYASGAVVKDGNLFIYYGGGDKYIGVAHAKLKDFVNQLLRNEHVVLSKRTSKVVI